MDPAWRPSLRLLGIAVLAVSYVILVPEQSFAASSASQPHASIDARRLVHTDWRANMAATFATMSELHTDRRITRPLQGQIFAGTLMLPSIVQLAGDTTILARRVVFDGDRVWIDTRGHSFAMLPIDSVRTGGERVNVLSDTGHIVIGGVAPSGTDGHNGGPGYDGYPGQSGQGGYSGDSCYPWRDGGDGMPGGDGTAGTEGGAGNGGTNSGDIAYAIPDDSTATYEFISRGGDGGRGGYGGDGGDGGQGGYGGGGGWGNCAEWIYGGTGGDGGDGGNASVGGNGGVGGKGGDGGNITVTFPQGFPVQNIATDAAPGRGGSGGVPGLPGTAGYGGSGGGPGCNRVDTEIYLCGDYGLDGLDGYLTGPAEYGGSGADGNAGTISVTPR